MRIISGSARGKRLASFSGREIRPTSDRVREALFSLLFSRMGTFEGTNVLDLFAGTGALALEALSRGAGRAVLVEADPRAARLISSNLQACKFEPRAVLFRCDALQALSRLQNESFDLIFLDPPYRRGLLEETLTGVDAKGLLKPGGILCAESDRGEEIPERIGTLFREDRRLYGTTAIHIFIHSAESPEP